YTVEWKDGKWTCNCPDYSERKKPCKHIYAVNFLLDLPMIVLSNSEAFTRICPKCGSANTGPKGFRYNKSGAVRIWRCKDCKKRFKDPLISEPAGAKNGAHGYSVRPLLQRVKPKKHKRSSLAGLRYREVAVNPPQVDNSDDEEA
ncbi:hypothetical protein DRP04_11720, partial [Archaeoglobales archaeon]